MNQYFFRLALPVVFLLCLLAGPGWAGQFKEISAPVVKNMLEKENVVVINLMSRLEHDLHHITGSINIPINELESSDKLPQDLDTSVIFYCMGFR